MTKPKIKWFTKELPTIKFNSHYFQPRQVLGYVSATQHKLARTSTLVRFVSLALPLSIYLYFGPQTAVLADWQEKVVPAPEQVRPIISETITAAKTPTFQFPVVVEYISTYFSRWHQGIDLPNPYQSPVRPISEGEVVFAGPSNLGYGNTVVVRHKLGYESLYAHLSAINVKQGDQVQSDTIIGLVGATGVASGNHLHLEVHQNGAAVNPLSILGK